RPSSSGIVQFPCSRSPFGGPAGGDFALLQRVRSFLWHHVEHGGKLSAEHSAPPAPDIRHLSIGSGRAPFIAPAQTQVGKGVQKGAFWRPSAPKPRRDLSQRKEGQASSPDAAFTANLMTQAAAPHPILGS